MGYIDDRKPMRKAMLDLLRNEKKHQDSCPHSKGVELSSFQPDAFCFLKLPTGEMIGVCLYCRKIISSIDPADNELFRTALKWSRNTPAEAIQFLSDKPKDEQLFRQLERYTPDEQNRILKLNVSSLSKQVKPELTDWQKQNNILHPDPTPDYYEMDMEDLKVLAQQQVDNYRKRR